jgi:hypothetical protein
MNRQAAMRALALLTLAFFAPLAIGCVSNEYVIPHDELGQLARTPPAERGKRVHAIQEIGERRADAIDVEGPLNPPPPPAPPPEARQGLASSEPAPDEGLDEGFNEGLDSDSRIQFDGNIDIGVDNEEPIAPGPHRGGDWRGISPSHSGGWRGTPASSSDGSNWHGSPASGGGGWRGAPGGGSTSGGAHGGGGVHVGGGGGGHVGGGGGGGGGGGNIGEAALVLAVVVAAVVVLIAVGVAASEGVRFDGFIEMSPDQPVHLHDQGGSERVVALGALTPTDVATTTEAIVMDDEGYGLRRIQHVLDRRGFAFKLDFGRVAFEQATSSATDAGPVAHLQLGYFFAPAFGVLLTAALGGASDGFGAVLTRHEVGLELQSLPLAAGPLHLGAYANGGYAMAATTAGGGAAEYGSSFGGGALVELDLTGRLALMVRAGGDLASFGDGWSPAASVSGGIAFY